LEWALDERVDFVPFNSDPSTAGDRAAGFDDIAGWIDDGRPAVARLQLSHVVAISGYCRSPGDSWLLVHDPLQSEPEWRVFDSCDYKGLWVAPPVAPAVRSDEAGWFTDVDGDGVSAFDEKVRFGTDPGRPDSDGDGVLDLNDIREYVFAADGAWDRGGTHLVTTGPGMLGFVRIADVDGDSRRKELDADNDGDGCRDGVEDANGNGVFDGELGESHNFITADCRPGILPGGCRCR
jgi:hypothetical protein